MRGFARIFGWREVRAGGLVVCVAAVVLMGPAQQRILTRTGIVGALEGAQLQALRTILALFGAAMLRSLSNANIVAESASRGVAFGSCEK